MRLFLAVNLDAGLRDEVHAAAEPLREIAPALAWVAAHKIHLTLKFLGEQPDEMMSRIGDAMEPVARAHRAFDVELGGVGAFPVFRRARVIWLGIEREPRLELLHHDVEEACAAVGLELDGRPYHPHVTLARVRERLPEDDLRALARAARRVNFRATMSVRTVDLVHSEPGPGGGRYTVVRSAALRSD